MLSLRQIIIPAVLLALVAPNGAKAQVGGAPAAPASLWNFLGIPQGIQKLRGATANRRGNHPACEPKPPLKAIADPKNLESKDAAIKKAAEVKQAEDLKKQKIKAVKYLASIGCGCYDVDGGVTDAMVASMGDCTEDVRYETIKAIADAADGECCSKCGKVCCCNKDVLLQLAAMAYQRDDTGCYLEPSERVREAAAEALVICCPTDTLPMIVEPEPGPTPELLDDESDEDMRELESGELPSVDEEVDPGAPVALFSLRDDRPEVRELPEGMRPTGNSHNGVVVHVSPSHQLAHVHLLQPQLRLPTGTVLIAYDVEGGEPRALARLKVIESFPGSANVAASRDDIVRIARGDLIVCPTQEYILQGQQARLDQEIAAAAPMPLQKSFVVRQPSSQPQRKVPGQAKTTLFSEPAPTTAPARPTASRPVRQASQGANLRQPVSVAANPFRR